MLFCENAVPKGVVGGVRVEWGRSPGAHREAGVRERGGGVQHEHVLHVPRHEEAAVRDGREPHRARAGPASLRQGPREGPRCPPRLLLRRPSSLHRRQAPRHHGPPHDLSHQRHPRPSSQTSRRSLALIYMSLIITLFTYMAAKQNAEEEEWSFVILFRFNLDVSYY